MCGSAPQATRASTGSRALPTPHHRVVPSRDEEEEEEEATAIAQWACVARHLQTHNTLRTTAQTNLRPCTRSGLHPHTDPSLWTPTHRTHESRDIGQTCAPRVEKHNTRGNGGNGEDAAQPRFSWRRDICGWRLDTRPKCSTNAGYRAAPSAPPGGCGGSTVLEMALLHDRAQVLSRSPDSRPQFVPRLLAAELRPRARPCALSKPRFRSMLPRSRSEMSLIVLAETRTLLVAPALAGLALLPLGRTLAASAGQPVRPGHERPSCAPSWRAKQHEQMLANHVRSKTRPPLPPPACGRNADIRSTSSHLLSTSAFC